MDISKNLPQMIKFKGHSGMENSSPASNTGHSDLSIKDQILISENGKDTLSSKESDNNKQEFKDATRITDLPPDSKVIMDKISDKLHTLKNNLSTIQNKAGSKSVVSPNSADSEKDGKIESNKDNDLTSNIPYIKSNQNKSPDSDKDLNPGEKINLML